MQAPAPISNFYICVCVSVCGRLFVWLKFYWRDCYYIEMFGTTVLKVQQDTHNTHTAFTLSLLHPCVPPFLVPPLCLV